MGAWRGLGWWWWRVALRAGPAASTRCCSPSPAGFRDVPWAREAPPGSGPRAAGAAGVAALPHEVDRVLVVGGDMPYVARATAALHEALGGSEVAVLVDVHGRDQPLAALWNRTSLTRALADLGPLRGVPLRRLLDEADVARVPDTWGAAQDVDTLEDLTRLADQT